MGLTTPGAIRQRARETPGHLRRLRPALARRRARCSSEPYERRRELLAGLGFDGPSWQAPRHHLGDGEALLGGVRERGLEGIVAKRLGSPYRPGRRSPDWVKVQNRRRQELVIGGFMPGEGGRGERVGSLLVGYWDATPEEAAALERPQRFVYAGGVGTGFTHARLDELTELLTPLRREPSPVRARLGPARSSTPARARASAAAWSGSSPSSSAEIEFTALDARGTRCAQPRSRAFATTRTRARSSGESGDRCLGTAGS